jgi:cholesterol oxidase
MRRSIGVLRPSKTLHAKNVIFAAGVLGTVPLLMKCRSEGHLPKLSERLGDRVRTNSEALVGVRSTRPDANLSHGIAIAAGVHIDKDTHVEVVRYSEGSDFLGFLSTVMTDGEGGPWMRRLRWLLTILLHPIDFLRSLPPFGWAKKTAILLVMQPIDNYLRLHWKRRWFWPFRRGLQSARETDKPIPVYFPRAHEVARRMAKKLDGIPQSSNAEILLNVPMTAHILGGCPMGKSGADGVIDEHCRVFGYDGLYVVDGSAIPSNLGVNPSLTITALAEYAISQIPEKPARASATASPRAPAAAEPENV